MDEKRQNNNRVAAIGKIFGGIIPGRYNGADPEANLTDLLTDLRHYCELEELDYQHLDALAYSHYCEENGQIEEGIGEGKRLLCKEIKGMDRNGVPEWVTKTNWLLLEKEKFGLLNIAERYTPEEGDTAKGILHFLDAVQDWVVDVFGDGKAPTEELPQRQFGKFGKVLLGAYHVERRYGGPEEPGWYYDRNEHLESRCVPEGDVAATTTELLEKYPNDGQDWLEQDWLEHTYVTEEKWPGQYQTLKQPSPYR
jgi:hypothetical protein